MKTIMMALVAVLGLVGTANASWSEQCGTYINGYGQRISGCRFVEVQDCHQETRVDWAWQCNYGPYGRVCENVRIETPITVCR